MAKSLLLLHGPNLNLLGTREPAIYGRTTLADINAAVATLVKARGAALSDFQSNHEGAMIERIHAAAHDGTDFIIINPGAWTHTSVALRDALAATGLAFIEVHLSNVHQREAFRHHSYFSDLAVGVVCGLGMAGYVAAAQFALDDQA